MMTRAKKAEVIAGLSERFGKANAAFLADFRGMDVDQVTNLRKQLSPLKSEIKVVRNTLAKLALSEHPETKEALEDEFVGNNAVIFAFEDVPSAAKALSEFSKTVEHFKIKSGYMDGQKLDQKEIKYLATLPSKDELRGMLLGTLAAPASQFVRLLSAVPSGFVRVLAAKKESEE